MLLIECDLGFVVILVEIVSELIFPEHDIMLYKVMSYISAGYSLFASA